jgi:hypothetical protein
VKRCECLPKVLKKMGKLFDCGTIEKHLLSARKECYSTCHNRIKAIKSYDSNHYNKMTPICMRSPIQDSSNGIVGEEKETARYEEYGSMQSRVA